eukprot:TRINITY_DN11448_c0_g1_i1.p1 TRINITY_DN11448_c0_g1~~TRINITY_DN11448_c0_g1_i1.p1  ORF type:complete len:547 (-),score=112.32 TRINITY_DN11448_c0_g1_i1:507-2075(-)
MATATMAPPGLHEDTGNGANGGEEGERRVPGEGVSPGDVEGPEVVQEMESLCMNCHENGMTRLLLTSIPHFRELVIMAFECPHCNERNSEVQFAGQLQAKGCRLKLQVLAGQREVLDRQVVKSDSATLSIPELEFEVPPESQKGSLSTVEGVIRKASSDLRLLQDERRRVDPELAERLDGFLAQLDACAGGERSFTMLLDDPAGNSFIQNPLAPAPDPLLTAEHYTRTPQQTEALGFLAAPDEDVNAATDAATQGGEGRHPPSSNGNGEAERGGPRREGPPSGQAKAGAGAGVGARTAIATISPETASALASDYSSPEEVMVFPGHCSACGAAADQRMFVTTIPHFKEVIIMAASCDTCGYKSSELKGGGAIPPKGRRIALRVKTARDITRDVIKSDSASVAIPEIELELTAGTLGGRVTTVEGLIEAISESLKSVQGFSVGDSAPQWQRSAWRSFDERLNKLRSAESEWTLIIEDHMANSFIAPLADTPDEDLQLVVEDYERSWEENEELGINDLLAGTAA